MNAKATIVEVREERTTLGPNMGADFKRGRSSLSVEERKWPGE